MKDELIQIMQEAESRGDMETAKAALLKLEGMTESTVIQPNPPTFMQDVARHAGGVIDAGIAMGSSAIAEPLAGSSSLFGLPEGVDTAVGMQDSTRERFTYQPRTQAGKEKLQAVGEFMAPVIKPMTEYINDTADKAFEGGGSWRTVGNPQLSATMAKTAPAALGELAGLGIFRRLRPETRLLTPEGTPTPLLENILHEKGLTYEGLTPANKAQIPEVTSKELIPSYKVTGGTKEGDIVGAQAQKTQLGTGGRDDELAQYRLSDEGVVIKDPLGIKAVKTGWKPGTVQMVKTMTPGTKNLANKMLSMRWQLLKNESNARKLFPLNVLGDEFYKRIQFLQSKANTARLQLDNIAKTRLKGVPIDTSNVERAIKDSFDNLGIKYNQSGAIKPGELDFSSSDFKVNRKAQNTIKQLLKLMDDTQVDAARMHLFKRQLDDMIDWKKSQGEGFTRATKNMLKDLRHAANETLRQTIPQYAEVNQTMHKVITALDEFKSASKVDIDFLENPGPAIGQEMRTLHTLYKKGNYVEQAVNRLDELAAEFGGEFDVNYQDLVQLHNRMDDIFGASKSGSFQGRTEAANISTTYATEGAPAAIRQAGRAAKEGIKEMIGDDHFDAYQSLRDLINAKQ